MEAGLGGVAIEFLCGHSTTNKSVSKESQNPYFSESRLNLLKIIISENIPDG